jgi:hypothetical protein
VSFSLAAACLKLSSALRSEAVFGNGSLNGDVMGIGLACASASISTGWKKRGYK